MSDRPLTPSQSSKPFATRAGRFIAAVAAIHILFLLNWFYGPVRFTGPVFNYLAAAVGLLCSWSLVLAVCLAPMHMAARLLCSVPTLLWAAGCSLLSLFSVLAGLTILSDGIDHTFEQIHVREYHGQRLVAYRTNHGATTSFGIVVRQELRLVPGLMLAKRIYAIYPGDEVMISQVDEHSFRIESPPYGNPESENYGGRTADVRIVRLGRFPL